MTNIAQVKVWNDAKGFAPNKNTEWRVYVKTTDGRDGCLYRTGNRWHPKNSVDGTLTNEEWQEARRLACSDGKWRTRWESELRGTIFGQPVKQAPFRCPDCGGYDCSPTRCDGWKKDLARNTGEDYRDSDARYEG